jgi:hypothetical protein
MANGEEAGRMVKPNAAPTSRRFLIFILVLALPAGALLFFHRMYGHDIKALKGFLASYENFDNAMPAVADNGFEGGLGRASKALSELQARASMRLSSLIRHDGELMSRARQVADLAQKEINAFGACEDLSEDRASAPALAANAKEISQGCELLREQRKAAFARFEELAGVNVRDTE